MIPEFMGVAVAVAGAWIIREGEKCRGVSIGSGQCERIAGIVSRTPRSIRIHRTKEARRPRRLSIRATLAGLAIRSIAAVCWSGLADEQVGPFGLLRRGWRHA